MSPATSSRLAKVARLAECLGHASPDEVVVAVAYLSGYLPQGTIGVGWAALRELPPPAPPPPISSCSRCMRPCPGSRRSAGSGSQAARRDALADLFGRATEDEQRFLERAPPRRAPPGRARGSHGRSGGKRCRGPRGAGATRRHGRRRSRRSRGGGARRGIGRATGVRPDRLAAAAADARADRGAISRTRSRASARPGSSGSWTAHACRFTGSGTRSERSRGTSPTSRTGCPRSSRSWPPSRSRRSCSTARRSRSRPEGDRVRSRRP